MLTTELRIISIFWACSPISFKHMIYFWCQFLDPHLTTYNSNVGVQIIVVLEWGTSTLRLIDICHSCLAKVLPQNLMCVCVCCMHIIETAKSCEERTPSELYLLEETVTNVNLIHNLPLSKRLEASSYVSTTYKYKFFIGIYYNDQMWNFLLMTSIGVGAVETSIASLIGRDSGKILKHILRKWCVIIIFVFELIWQICKALGYQKLEANTICMFPNFKEVIWDT
jgi:hypothetical protein